MAIEHINELDTLNAGREKINKHAINPANRAELNSIDAKSIANQANQTSQSAEAIAINTDDRLDNIIAGEMQDAEVIDARKPFGSEAYQTLGERLDSENAKVSAQLAETNKKFTNEINITDFPRLVPEINDTQRFQRAIDSFEGNIAGTIVIPYDIYVSSQITCNKTGLRIVGLNNKISRIISSAPEKTLHIEPLYNGSPYTNVAYCKFYMDNIAIIAEGVAQSTGTGIYLKWIYASSFLNLMTLGFKKHIVLRGSHLNTFYNLFQGNYNTNIQGTEIHNRGVGLSADGLLDEAGESTSNNNHIVGGWINNTSWDLRGMPGTIVEMIDIEPASNTFYTGDNAIFKDCRIERMDLYALRGEYERFPWFVVGSLCKFYNNEYHNEGQNNDVNINPIFLIEGNYNEIEVPLKNSFNIGFLTFGENAKGNTVEFKTLYNDIEYKQEHNTIKYNNHDNKLIFIDFKNGNLVENTGDYSFASGRFTCRNSLNTVLYGNENYIAQGCISEPVDIPLPFGKTNEPAFAKITLNTDLGNRRFLSNTNLAQKAPYSGVFTLTATVYIPSTSSTSIKIGATLQANTLVHTRDKWVTVRSRVRLTKDEMIVPCFTMADGVTGDVFYVGEISVCDGNNAIYIENNTINPVQKVF